MFKVIFILLAVTTAGAQEIEDLHTQTKHKYAYTHEEFSSANGESVSEEWFHLRSGDLTGSVEMTQKKQLRISLNSTAARLIGMNHKSMMGKFLNKIQIEGRSDSKRADYALLGIETGLGKRLSLLAAGVLNDADTLRPLVGVFCYWRDDSYSAVLLYADKNFQLDSNYSVTLRNHIAIDKAFVEGNVSGKVKDDHTYYGAQAKAGMGPLAVRYEYSPKYEGSELNRSLYGIELAYSF